MNTTITKKAWLALVKAEIDALKKTATKKELDKLSEDSLDPDLYTNCIYGLMTGDCRSYRAVTMINACCQKFTKNEGNVIDGSTFEKTRDFINGVDHTERDEYSRITYFSSLEHYILLKGANISGIISYLKGETETLEL